MEVAKSAIEEKVVAIILYYLITEGVMSMLENRPGLLNSIGKPGTQPQRVPLGM